MDLLITALLALGALLVIASCLGAVLVRDELSALHFLAPVSSLGTPLIGIAAALDSGWQWNSVWILFITAVLACTGPIAQASIGRTAARNEEIL